MGILNLLRILSNWATYRDQQYKTDSCQITPSPENTISLKPDLAICDSLKFDYSTGTA